MVLPLRSILRQTKKLAHGPQGIAKKSTQEHARIKHKDLAAENVPNTLRILHRLLRLLMLTGLTSNSTKGNDLRFANQTKGAHVANGELVGDVLNLVSRLRTTPLAEQFSVRTIEME